MSIRIFLCFLAALATANLAAGPRESAKGIENYAHQELSVYFKNKLGKANFEKNYVIKVSSLDPRLSLELCESGKKLEVVSNSYNNSHLTAKVFCESGKRWNLYVPVRIEQYDQAAVSAINLPRGHILSKDDIKMSRKKVSQLGHNYIDSPSKIYGLKLKRALRAGEAIKTSLLSQPKVVARGDKVTLESRLAGINVSAKAVALESGQVGSVISVKNTRSSRIVDARITGPGRVLVGR